MAQGSESDNIIRPGQFSGTAGGSGPDDPGVEARLSRLETAVDEMRKELQAIRIDLAEIKGKLSNMPTTVTLFGLVVTVFGAAFALVKLTSMH
jgi:hypothetical protein